MQKVKDFCRQLEHPSTWAKAHDLPPYLISRLRKGHVKVMTTRYMHKLIQAANGKLCFEDFRHD